MTKVVRLVAKYSEGKTPSGNYRFVIVCGIDDENRIVEGEWMGFIHNNDVYHPFRLERSPKYQLNFGGEEKYYEPTTLGATSIEVGNQFTVSNHPDDVKGDWTVSYCITSVHPLS